MRTVTSPRSGQSRSRARVPGLSLHFCWDIDLLQTLMGFIIIHSVVFLSLYGLAMGVVPRIRACWISNSAITDARPTLKLYIYIFVLVFQQKKPTEERYEEDAKRRGSNGIRMGCVPGVPKHIIFRKNIERKSFLYKPTE
jgi:hypothetical protein